MVINGAVALFHNGTNMAQTQLAASGGLLVNNLFTGAGFERVLTTADLSGSPFTEIILTNSNVIDLVDTDVALNIGAAVPGSNPHLELGLFGVGSGIQAKADATTIDTLDINPLGGTLNLGPPASAAVAGNVNLRVANGAGSGGNVIETTISGFILEGRTGSNTILDFHAVNANLAMRMVFNGANLQFDGFQDSLEFQFQSRDSGSTIRQLLHMDPDDNIALFDQGVEVARTLGASAGGWEVNNTLTGAGFERVLTESDIGGASGFLFVNRLDTTLVKTSNITPTEMTDLSIDDTIYTGGLSGTEKIACLYYVDAFVFGNAGGARFGHRYINTAHLVETRGLHQLALDTTSSVAAAEAGEQARGDIGTSATATAFTLNGGVSAAMYKLRSKFLMTSNTQTSDIFRLFFAQGTSNATPSQFERGAIIRYGEGTLLAS
jgi:hypothetical protein